MHAVLVVFKFKDRFKQFYTVTPPWNLTVTRPQTGNDSTKTTHFCWSTLAVKTSRVVTFCEKKHILIEFQTIHAQISPTWMQPWTFPWRKSKSLTLLKSRSNLPRKHDKSTKKGKNIEYIYISIYDSRSSVWDMVYTLNFLCKPAAYWLTGHKDMAKEPN